jgi:hypothetical protein
MGLRHLRLLQEYEAQINRLATSLYEDCRRFRPLAGNYSPYGAIYGTPSNLTELIALKTLQPGAETGFGLEDAFADSEADAARLAWADGWRKMPHINQEVQSLYSYPQQFAEEIFQVIEKSLSSRGADGPTVGKYRTGRLFILTGQELSGESEAAQIPDLAVRFISSSDEQVVAAREAEFMDEVQLLRDRQEGHFVLSFKTAGGWIAISKDMLTDVLGAGKDVRIVGLPAAAAGVLRLMCPHQASIPPSTVKD